MTARTAARHLAPYVAALHLTVLPACDGCAPAPQAVPETPLAQGLAADDRIAWLLAPCAQSEPFLADTGDPVAVLVAKLERGQLDPMRQARTELAALGEAAVPELSRLFERALRDPDGGPVLLNVLSVVASMDTRAGRGLLVAALGHPQDTVRIEAVRGLSRHGLPEDYDRLMALVPIASNDALASIGAALATADRTRWEDDFVSGPKDPPALWMGAPERMCRADRPEILERLREIVPSTEGEARYFLSAALARAGDADALAFLRKALADPSPVLRTLAARAFACAGMIREIAPLLWEDGNEALRGLVARTIAAEPPSLETAGWLRRGTFDLARTVQLTCLAALAERGDAEARDQGLTLLERDRADLEYGITVLRGAWAKDPALAERSLEVLERLRSGLDQPLRVDPLTIDRAIAQLPLIAAARLLYDRARRTPGEIESLPAHRWYLMQAGNTGRDGRAWLRARWAEETDPTWRVDIAMAGAGDKDGATLEFLLGIADDERSTPLEVLHAANLVAHQGPAAVVAPRLKRAALRCSDPVVRPALNCLLWRWYGPEP